MTGTKTKAFPFSVTLIQKPAELPKDLHAHYVRLRSNPQLLQHSFTGALYALKNGNDWPRAGYVWRQKLNGSFELHTCEDKIG